MTLRGTILLADNVYRTVEGKFIICGTYNRVMTQLDAFAPTFGLFLYVRILVERGGPYQARLVISDETADPRTPVHVLRQEFDVVVRPEEVPVHEGVLRMDGLSLRCPVPAAQRVPGVVHQMRCCVRFFFKEPADRDFSHIGECPLTISFTAPGGPTGTAPGAGGPVA